jgi:hypothetical protein
MRLSRWCIPRAYKFCTRGSNCGESARRFRDVR